MRIKTTAEADAAVADFNRKHGEYILISNRSYQIKWVYETIEGFTFGARPYNDDDMGGSWGLATPEHAARAAGWKPECEDVSGLRAEIERLRERVEDLEAELYGE